MSSSFFYTGMSPQEHEGDERRRSSLLRSGLVLDVQLPELEKKRKHDEGVKGRAKRLVKLRF